MSLISPELKAALSIAGRQTNLERALARAGHNLARVSIVFASGTGRVVTTDVATTWQNAISR